MARILHNERVEPKASASCCALTSTSTGISPASAGPWRSNICAGSKSTTRPPASCVTRALCVFRLRVRNGTLRARRAPASSPGSVSQALFPRPNEGPAVARQQRAVGHVLNECMAELILEDAIGNCRAEPTRLREFLKLGDMREIERFRAFNKDESACAPDPYLNKILEGPTVRRVYRSPSQCRWPAGAAFRRPLHDLCGAQSGSVRSPPAR